MAIATIQELKNAPAAQASLQRDIEALPPKRRVAALLEQHKGGILAALPKHLTGERLLKVATIAVTTTPAAKSNPWYPDHGVFSATKDQLKAMPEFKYST